MNNTSFIQEELEYNRRAARETLEDDQVYLDILMCCLIVGSYLGRGNSFGGWKEACDQAKKTERNTTGRTNREV